MTDFDSTLGVTLLSEYRVNSIDNVTGPEKAKPLISSIITATSNFSVQYNFQSISIALLVMSASECTSNDDSCKSGEQAEWVTGTATATGTINLHHTSLINFLSTVFTV
jgi:hypothetical protein